MDRLVLDGILTARLERRADGQLWISRAGQSCAVTLARCFPWSARTRFISLRNDDRQEVCLIDDPAGLDPDSRATLEHALVEADFVLDVERIHDIDEEIEIRCWDVTTSRGHRKFQTRRDDWPRIVPGGGVLIRDVAGDLYYIKNPGELDQSSQRLLDAYVD